VSTGPNRLGVAYAANRLGVDVPADPSEIAFVHDSRRFDGLRNHCLEYAEATEAAGTPVALYTCVDPSARAEYAIDGTAIWGRRFPGVRLEMAANRGLGVFARRIARLPQRLVHVGSVHLAGAASRRRGVVITVADIAKRTTRLYSTAASWLHNFLLRSVHRAAAVTTPSEWVRADVAKVTGFPIERIVVAPLWARPPVPPIGEVPPPAYPSADHPWTVLLVSTDRPHKNIGAFLRLIRDLGPEYRGRFIGRASPATRVAVERLGLSSRLSIGTDVPSMTNEYRAAQVLVQPSRYEGFGGPVLEAMTHGVPVVVSRATALPELVGDAGALVDPDDAAGWLAAVRALSAEGAWSAAHRRSLARAAEYTIDRTGRALATAYEIASLR